MTHTSTVNLTIDVVTEHGLDPDLTAKWFADRVAYRLEQVLPTAGIRVRVQSAFIAHRGDDGIPTPDEVEPGAEWWRAPR